MKIPHSMKATVPVGLLLATMVTPSFSATEQQLNELGQSLNTISSQALVKPIAQTASAFPYYSAELQQAIKAGLDNPNEVAKQSISIAITSKSGRGERLAKILKKKGVRIQSQTIKDTIMAVASPQVLQAIAKHPLLATASMQGVAYAAVSTNIEVKDKVEPQQVQAIVALTSTKVALELLKRAAHTQSNVSENIIFSPWSIIEATTAVILANDDKNPITRPDWLFPLASQQQWLTSYAARPASTNFRSKNYLWLQEGSSVSPIFKASYEKELAGHVEALDFGKVSESVKRINQQVATDTEQKITDLLSDKNLVPTPVSILTNAVYFKASWQSSFLAESTKQEDFHNASGKMAKVPMMSQTQQYKLARVDKWTLLEMPFKDNAPEGLWLMLPPADTPLALPSMETLTKLEAALSPEKISLSLPKIKLAGENMNLKNGILPEIAKWQLNQLIVGQSLPIGEAIHKATIEWDEIGATAAAATAVIVAKSLSLPPPEIVFNRPFVFMIRQQQNTLFAGQIRQLP